MVVGRREARVVGKLQRNICGGSVMFNFVIEAVVVAFSLGGVMGVVLTMLLTNNKKQKKKKKTKTKKTKQSCLPPNNRSSSRRPAAIAAGVSGVRPGTSPM